MPALPRSKAKPELGLSSSWCTSKASDGFSFDGPHVADRAEGMTRNVMHNMDVWIAAAILGEAMADLRRDVCRQVHYSTAPRECQGIVDRPLVVYGKVLRVSGVRGSRRQMRVDPEPAQSYHQ